MDNVLRHAGQLRAPRTKTSWDSWSPRYEWGGLNRGESFGLATAASPAGSSVGARRLCVVSRTPLVSGVFIAGLTSLVGSRDELEIVVDRRRDDPARSQPPVERRHRTNVVRALERDGFAVVLVPPPSAPEEVEAPTDRMSAEEAYEHRLERLLRFKHRRMVRVKRWLVLSAVVNVIFGLCLLAPTVKALLQKTRPAAPASSILPKVSPDPASRLLSP